MRCTEFQDAMRSFLDGEVDGKTRREIGRHLAECEACGALIENNRFWDDALRRHLDHELPAGLREDILGDLAPYGAGTSTRSGEPTLDDLGWRKQLRIAWWAVRRDLKQPRDLLQVAALAAVVILAVNYLPFFRSSDRTDPEQEAFLRPGPIVQVGQDAQWSPGEPVPTARLTLSGRLI